MPVRRMMRIFLNNKIAESHVVSATILAGVAVALGLGVFAWAQARSSDYVNQYSETMNAETAKLRERLAVEYIVYDENADEIWIYLFSWGAIDDVEIQTVYIGRGTWHVAASNFALRFLNGTSIPDQDLDEGEEGYIIVSSSDLEIGGYYHVRIVTVRGTTFDSTFVAQKIFKDSKGVSTAVGTVLLTITVFAVFSNILYWTIYQNTLYSESVRKSNQTDADRFNEKVIASDGNYSVLGDKVKVEVTLTNVGAVAVQIINLWVFDTTQQKYGFNNTISSLNLNLNPGNALDLTGENAIIVTIDEARSLDKFNSWFVTARGNTVPVEKEEDITVAQVAQGIGSINMDFRTFRYYEVTDNQLGLEKFSFSIPGKKDTVFGVYLTNLDESRRPLNLSSHSCIWLIIPGSSTSASWPITKVEDNTILTFDFQVLEYRKPTLVFFGKTKPSQLADNIAAVNILLYGTIGGDDYGQNIPFISVYVES